MSSSPLVCVDASVALAAVLQNDPDHAAALILIANLVAQNATLCAPALFTYECNSVIRLNVFRGTLTEAEAQTALQLIDALGVVLECDPVDSQRALEIATDYHQPRAYDAAYVAHAQARGLELITADKPFYEALNGSKRPKTAPALTFVRLLK